MPFADGVREQDHRRDLAALAAGGQHRDQAALAVADEGDAFLVDALLFLEPQQRMPRVFRVVGDRRRFGAAAALADAALVVAHDREAGRHEIAGEVSEDRNAGDGLIAIGRAGTADQDHRRQRCRRRSSAA